MLRRGRVRAEHPHLTALFAFHPRGFGPIDFTGRLWHIIARISGLQSQLIA